MTFKLKYMFCLVLIIGVVLMWGPYGVGRRESASQLIYIRDNVYKMTFSQLEIETLRVPSDSNNLVNIGLTLHRGDGLLWGSPFTLWMDCVLHVKWDDNRQMKWHSWQADWPTIEAKAREENWTFYRQVIVTVLAVLTIGLVVIRGRRK